MRADAESSCTESRTDCWSQDGARNPWSAPTTELWAPTGPERSNTAQRIPARQPRGRPSSHRVGALAVLPRTMSRSWPRPTSTMLVPQALVRNRPRRIIKCSSRPSADTREIRSVSASSSAAPQRLTAELTVCHTQPRSAATSLSGRPRPAWRVAHRAALAVNSALAGAISAACSVALPASQPPRGQRQRRLCHTSRTGRPNAGRSTSATGRSPSDHNSPPHPPHGGLGTRRRMRTRSGAPSLSSMPSTATSTIRTMSRGWSSSTA